MNHIREQIATALASLRERTSLVPRVGMILGTGLGGLADQIQSQTVIPYENIPHFPSSTVESHAGQLVLGQLYSTPVVAMEGRFHFYEGYSMQEITFPVRVMKALGVEYLFVTNAAGGLNPHHNLGDIVLIEDHINLMTDNPLRGINDDSLGPRFPDMFAPYDPGLIAIAQNAARELAIPAHKGVFVAVTGPNLETRAEYRMLRNMGADIVGMSTVPEILVAVHAGLKTLGLSVITDLCTPETLQPINIQHILNTAAKGGEKLTKLIPHILKQIGV